MLSRKKKYLLIGAGAIVAGALAFFFFPLPQPNPAVDECKFELARVIGKSGDLEFRLYKVSCGIEMPFFEVSAHSPKFSEADSRENSMELSEEDTCDSFADSLYNQDNILIGCCPLGAPAGSGELRENVFATRVDPETGKFDIEDHPGFPNIVSTYDPKRDREVPSPSCTAKTLKVDYDKLMRD